MITEDVKIKICDSYRKGITLRKIAEMYGVSQNSVLTIIKSRNVRQRETCAIPDKARELAIKMYIANDCSTKDILQATGIRSERTLYDILKVENVPGKRKRK